MRCSEERESLGDTLQCVKESEHPGGHHFESPGNKKQKIFKHKALPKPEYFCHFCAQPTKVENLKSACVDCFDERRVIDRIIREVRDKFPITRTMSIAQILDRLWQYRKEK